MHSPPLHMLPTAIILDDDDLLACIVIEEMLYLQLDENSEIHVHKNSLGLELQLSYIHPTPLMPYRFETLSFWTATIAMLIAGVSN